MKIAEVAASRSDVDAVRELFLEYGELLAFNTSPRSVSRRARRITTIAVLAATVSSSRCGRLGDGVS